jgi:hypothetical protein
MKTSKKLSFPKLENEFLENILRQLVNQYPVIQIFFTRQAASAFSYLIIHIEKNADVEKLQEFKWVRKARNRYQINVCFLYSSKLHHRFFLAYPFIELYCQPSAIIYQNETSQDALIISRSWKKYKKKFNVLLDHFYDDHDLHQSQIRNLIAENSSNSVLTAYERLLEYDLEYLEELCLGYTLQSLSLNKRISNLIAFIPEIQKYFVRNSSETYFLTNLFAQAKKAIENDVVIYENEMFEAVRISEQNLFRLIIARFDELKKLLKKEDIGKHEIPCQIEIKPKDQILDIAVVTILNLVEIEQIYLYHQITYAEKTTYYLMLIASGGTNEKLRLITHLLKSKVDKNSDFVLISHSRKWIQENLYQYQSFFSNIIQATKLIYSSSAYHPELHWKEYDNPYHADLYFYYKPTKDVALQFFEIANNPKENFQGLEYFFSLFFLSFCRTYIFVKIYYLPNDLTSQALWQLCIYADADIRQYNHLVEQFWTDFFPYLNKYRVLHHKLSKLNKEEVGQMSSIVDKLMNELDDLVIKGGLLSNLEGEI